jgi:N-acetylmuramoyl-L-alanine amidase
LIALRALLLSVAVVRFRIWLASALAFGAIVAGLLRAQVNEEQQRNQTEAIETRPASSPKPRKSPSPASKAKGATRKSTKTHRAAGTPKKSPSATVGAKPTKEKSSEAGNTASKTRETPERSASPKSKRRHTATPKAKATKKKSGERGTSHKGKKSAKSKSTLKEEELPKPRKTPAPSAEEKRAAPSEASTPPAPRAIAAPASTPQPKTPRTVSPGRQAQVVIEKSGLEEDQGFEPPPSPPRRGFWPWSRPTNYRYLTSSVIEAIRRAPVKRHRWQFIVVHNSGTRQGNARVFDYYHRHVRRMQNGLAYHFVIGNGASTGNGQIEVGDRWRRQINGGHVHSDYLNSISLGICLVGDFNRDQPTRAQLDACEELIRYLRQRCGGTGRGAIPVKPHREMNPPRWPTDCPGDDFPYSWFRRF